MKSLIGKILIVIGWTLLTIAATIVISDYIEVYGAYRASEKVMGELEKAIEREIVTTKDIEIADRKYVGVIEIPTLDIKLPVLEECTDINLKISPCKYYGDVYKNENMVLAAHNYPKFFGNIKHLKKGDDIYFTALNGNEIEYKVDKIETLYPEDVEGMTNTEYELSLFSCNYPKDKRVTVRCIKQ